METETLHKETGESPNMPCNDRCVFAKSNECNCSCGGENHGSGRQARLFVFGENGAEPHPSFTSKKTPAAKRYIVGQVGSRRVYFDGRYMDPAPSQKLRNHSPDGYMWGYGGSGPAQLALAILLKVTDKRTAQRLYQTFKFEVVAGFSKDTDFKYPISKVRKWIKEKQHERT